MTCQAPFSARRMSQWLELSRGLDQTERLMAVIIAIEAQVKMLFVFFTMCEFLEAGNTQVYTNIN